jgi:hypothetical protein
MIDRFHRRRRHPGQGERTAHLFPESRQDFHFATRVLVSLPVLNVDHTDNSVPRDHRRGKERFECVFRQFAEIFEPRVPVRLARNRQETPLPGYPSGQPFVQFQPDTPDFRLVMRVRSAKNKVIAIAKIDQTGIAFRIFDYQGNNALQNFLQTHFPNHKPAHLLKEPKLLLDPLQAALNVFCLRHGIHYSVGTGYRPVFASPLRLRRAPVIFLKDIASNPVSDEPNS